MRKSQIKPYILRKTSLISELPEPTPVDESEGYESYQYSNHKEEKTSKRYPKWIRILLKVLGIILCIILGLVVLGLLLLATLEYPIIGFVCLLILIVWGIWKFFKSRTKTYAKNSVSYDNISKEGQKEGSRGRKSQGKTNKKNKIRKSILLILLGIPAAIILVVSVVFLFEPSAPSLDPDEVDAEIEENMVVECLPFPVEDKETPVGSINPDHSSPIAEAAPSKGKNDKKSIGARDIRKKLYNPFTGKRELIVVFPEEGETYVFREKDLKEEILKGKEPNIIPLPFENFHPSILDKYDKIYNPSTGELELIVVFREEGESYVINDKQLIADIEFEEWLDSDDELDEEVDEEESTKLGEESNIETLSSNPSDESSSMLWLWIALAVAAAGGVGFWIYYNNKNKKLRIKLVANKDCTVFADNKEIAKLKATDVSLVPLAKGQYYLRFEPAEKDIKPRNSTVTVKKNEQLINIEFPDTSSEKKNVIKCFIAGSTKLEAERNALRSGIAQTHNAWRGKNFEILSYTYEDFDKKVVDGGHQSKYDEFIQNDATLAIFIISGEIGKYTITEFNKAMNAFKNGTRPQILIFNDANAPQHSQSEDLKKIVAKEKQYWTDYDSISTLRLQFMHTLDWMLIELFYH